MTPAVNARLLWMRLRGLEQDLRELGVDSSADQLAAIRARFWQDNLTDAERASLRRLQGPDSPPSS